MRVSFQAEEVGEGHCWLGRNLKKYSEMGTLIVCSEENEHIICCVMDW